MNNEMLNRLWPWVQIVVQGNFTVLGEPLAHVYTTNCPWVAFADAPQKIASTFFQLVFDEKTDQAQESLQCIIADVKNQVGGEVFANPDFMRLKLTIAIIVAIEDVV